MNKIYIFIAATFIVSFTAFCIAAMIQMSHPWVAPWWMGLTVHGVCWSALAAFLLIALKVFRHLRQSSTMG